MPSNTVLLECAGLTLTVSHQGVLTMSAEICVAGTLIPDPDNTGVGMVEKLTQPEYQPIPDLFNGYNEEILYENYTPCSQHNDGIVSHRQ